MPPSYRDERQRWRRETLAPFEAKTPTRSDVPARGDVPTRPDLSVPDPDFDPCAKLGFPGEFPFTRGIYPTMYRGRAWTQRQYAGFGSARETNARFRYLLSQGMSGLSVAFDLPTQMGYDSDHALALGEVGKVGVAISTLEDFDALMADIPLDQVTVSMTINATAAILLSMVLVTARRRGIPWAKLGGTVQNDILKEYIARGTYIFPPQPSLRLVGDIFAFCERHVPRWNTISISGYHIREAGATALQELAFTLADGICYVEHALRRGLDVNRFGRRLSFFFNAHNDLLEETAKYRAARRLWAQLMRDRFGATDPRACMLRFHTQTAGSTLTAQQPEVNAVRVTIQALAAVLGGTQSLHTNARDEALGLPTEAAATLALRTQQVIAHESGLAEHVDPLAGSYLVEAWTDELEARAKALIDEIDRRGGAVTALEAGFFQRAIERSAFEAQRRIESGQDVVVGVNRYHEEAGAEIPVLTVDPALEREQIARLGASRARRDQAACDQALISLRRAAQGEDILIPPIIDALEHGATLGEISDALRAVFGVYRPR